MVLIFYGTSACHLCDEAEKLLSNPVIRGLLRKRSVAREYCDIANHPEQFERLGPKIPVLGFKGSSEELCWPFSLPELRAFLDAGCSERG